MVARSPEDPSIRVLACLKYNVGAKPPSLGYRILDEGHGAYVEWTGQVDCTADDLQAAPGKKATALERAVDFLKGQLQESELEVQTLLARASSAGVSERTLYRARKELPIRTIEKGPERKTFWTMDRPDSVEALLARPDVPALAGAPANAV
jgi:DNA repair protein RadA/Sms